MNVSQTPKPSIVVKPTLQKGRRFFVRPGVWKFTDDISRRASHGDNRAFSITWGGRIQSTVVPEGLAGIKWPWDWCTEVITTRKSVIFEMSESKPLHPPHWSPLFRLGHKGLNQNWRSIMIMIYTYYWSIYTVVPPKPPAKLHEQVFWTKTLGSS